jgi:hypothetical protein
VSLRCGESRASVPASLYLVNSLKIAISLIKLVYFMKFPIDNISMNGCEGLEDFIDGFKDARLS